MNVQPAKGLTVYKTVRTSRNRKHCSCNLTFSLQACYITSWPSPLTCCPLAPFSSSKMLLTAASKSNLALPGWSQPTLNQMSRITIPTFHELAANLGVVFGGYEEDVELGLGHVLHVLAEDIPEGPLRNHLLKVWDSVISKNCTWFAEFCHNQGHNIDFYKVVDPVEN